MTVCRVARRFVAAVALRAAPQLRADESAAAAAEQAGRLREAFSLYVAAYQSLPDPPPRADGFRLRERIIKLASRLDPPPEVPEEARRRAVRGQVMFGDAKDVAGLERARAELQQAVRLAPWYATALYNLAVVERRLELYKPALANFKLYLLTSPADAEQAQAAIYEVEYRLEQQAEALQAYQRGSRPADDAAAAALYRAACDAEVARGCTDLGSAYEYGSGVSEDSARATALWDEGCERGDGKGCQLLAHKLDGAGDLPRSVQAFQRGCDVGWAASCAALARRYYAHYANRVRGERPSEELGRQEHEEEQPKKRRCSPSWARLISKVYRADPFVCKRCGGPLKVVAYITDTVAIRRILDPLGLSPPEKPPPEVRVVLRVPVDDEGREIGANPA